MSANNTVLTITTGIGQRGAVGLVAFVFQGFGRLARAFRHRRELAMLAGLEGHMLADIGISRSDLRDALSEPLWEDPSALLRERALERRWNRALLRSDVETAADPAFHRLPTARPARQLI